MNSSFLIAAPHSGAGKTTVTLGLLRAFRRKGFTVRPFKCGPDFIDPIHHRTAAGLDSVNLDRYMMSDDHIRDLYNSYTADAGVSIVEGVMGLYDGAVKSEGSAAALAKLLDLPVILVLNAKAMAYSAAAILYGLKHFDPAVKIAGVIFNFVGSEGHYRILREAAADVGVTALGYLPVDEALRIPSRHLGLDTADAEAAIDAAAGLLEKQVDLEELLEVTRAGVGEFRDGNSGEFATISGEREGGARRLNILVARDEAFTFTYRENIRRLEEWGTVTFFSPLRDTRFPVKPDLVYLPGGYPELYLPELAENTALLAQLRTHIAGGGKILAECGGMMYLGRSITDGAGVSYNMAGIIDAVTSMQAKRLSLGYRTVRLPGGVAKGHEFHYSQYRGELPETVEAYNARGEAVSLPFFRSSGILASYMHFYWGEDPRFLESWLTPDGRR